MVYLYLYLVYGLAFIALGLIVGLQARLPLGVVDRGLLGLLAGFGLTHGVHEWSEMAFLIQGPGGRGAPVLRVVGPVALAASFALLAQFGVRRLVIERRSAGWLRLVPLAAFVAWVYVCMLGAPPFGLAMAPAAPVNADSVARWFLGFPAALVAAAGLASLARRWQSEAPRIGWRLRAGAVVLVMYGIAAGLFVIGEPLEPVALLDGYPVVTNVVLAARIACATALVFFLSVALVDEANKLAGAVESARLRQQFVSAVVHDLRSSLTAIDVSARGVERLRHEEHGSPREAKLIHLVRRGTASLETIVNDLMDASLVETRRIPLDLQTVDLRALVERTIELDAPLTEGHLVELVVPSPPPPIAADPRRLEQILTNLLSNAAKYSYAGSAIVVEVRGDGDEAAVSVTNRGPGVARADMPELFKLFYRGKSTASKPGLGLGLYIVEGLVAAHGGRMSVDSEVGRFATFRFSLPRAPAVGAPKVAPAGEQKRAA